jgi:hypothetical protein
VVLRQVGVGAEHRLEFGVGHRPVQPQPDDNGHLLPEDADAL